MVFSQAVCPSQWRPARKGRGCFLTDAPLGPVGIQPRRSSGILGLFSSGCVSSATTEIKAEGRSKQLSWFLWVCASRFHFPASPVALLRSLPAALSSASLLPPGGRELAALPARSQQPPFPADLQECQPRASAARVHSGSREIDDLCRSGARFSPVESLSARLAAQSADSGLLGPRETAEKGLSRGRRAARLPRSRLCCSDPVPSRQRPGFPLLTVRCERAVAPGALFFNYNYFCGGLGVRGGRTSSPRRGA